MLALLFVSFYATAVSRNACGIGTMHTTTKKCGKPYLRELLLSGKKLVYRTEGQNLSFAPDKSSTHVRRNSKGEDLYIAKGAGGKLLVLSVTTTMAKMMI